MGSLESPRERVAFRRRLLKWFDQNQRDLPWRRRPNLYRVWVSEIMLQQTQVATVVDYYRRFIKRFPNVKQLAAAKQQDVLRMWEGLGYYRRARQLHLAAQVVVRDHRGKFPRDLESVRSLPGIGRYTAAAILSIADEQRHAIVEGNTMRLYSRLFAFPKDPRKGDGQNAMWEFADMLIGRKRFGDTNQALMELGAEICKPHDPDCQQCPVRRFCAAYQENLVERLPAKPEKKTRYESKQEAAVVIRRRGKLLLRQCGEDQRWEGLWDFPRFDVTGAENVQQLVRKELKRQSGLEIDPGPVQVTMKHAVTRYRIELSCFVAKQSSGTISKSPLLEGAETSQYQWVNADELASLPLNVTGRKLVEWMERR